MTTNDLDTYTDGLARTDSSMFPSAEKLTYYNIAYGLLQSLIFPEQEDTWEEEDTKDTVADQNNVLAKARIHHINWLKLNYGDGFVPATYLSEADQISQFGNRLETELAQWPKDRPIYWFKGKNIFFAPAMTADQAGADRLWVSQELIQPDLNTGDTPDLPIPYHYLLGVYAAWQYHDKEGEAQEAANRKLQWEEGMSTMLETSFPRARERNSQAHVPDDDGSSY